MMIGVECRCAEGVGCTANADKRNAYNRGITASARRQDHFKISSGPVLSIRSQHIAKQLGPVADSSNITERDSDGYVDSW